MDILNDFYTLHIPGEGKARLGYMFKNLKQISVSDKVTIVTVATIDVLDKCPLIRQLDSSGVYYVNAAPDYCPGEWKKTDKIQMVLDGLNKVETDYVLVLDANDVKLLRDIDDEFIEKWKSFDSPLVYNASEHLYPKIFANIKERNSIFCQHYLNAGVAFGLTEYAKKVYQTAYEESQSDRFPKFDSEQYYVRIAWETHKEIELDVRQKLFLLSHGN